MVKKSFLDEVSRGMREMVHTRRGIGHPDPIMELVLDRGQVLKGSALPADIPRGEKKACFQNAYRLATNHGQWRYMEGYAVSARIGFPLHHAWCINARGEVVDNTWDEPEDTVYVGVSIDRDSLLLRTADTGVYGVFFKDDYSGPDLDWISSAFNWTLSPVTETESSHFRDLMP